MSHVSVVACEIKDLDELRAAAEKFGAELLYGKTTFKGYGSEKSPCLHAIKVPGTTYEVGLRRKTAEDPDTYELACDFFDGKIAAAFGDGMVNLRNEYTALVAEKALRRRGYRVAREEAAGRIELRAYA
jgi:hypothetical protein